MSFGARVATPRTPGDSLTCSATAGPMRMAINKTMVVTSNSLCRGIDTPKLARNPLRQGPGFRSHYGNGAAPASKTSRNGAARGGDDVTLGARRVSERRDGRKALWCTARYYSRL